MKKCIGSLLLSLVLCLSLLPAAALAEAEDSAVHSDHPICGDTACTDEAHRYTGSWTGVSTLTNDMDAGYYYLEGDVTLSSTWEPINDVVLCLNGHSIRVKGDKNSSGPKPVINLVSAVTLTLTDCKGDGDTYGQITHETLDTQETYKCGVFIDGASTFNMYGGSITGNEHYYGGGVYVYNGTFNMYGGEISGNEAGYNGGGVYVNQEGTFNMYGGEITGNTSYQYGGGVFVRGEFTISGSPVIAENKVYSRTENVHLRSEQSITITIGEGGLGDDAEIGVTVSYPPAEGKTVTVATNASGGDAAYFTYDAGDDYEFKLDGSNVVMAKKAPEQEQEHEHALCAGTDCTDPDHEDGGHGSVTFSSALEQENGELRKDGKTWNWLNSFEINIPSLSNLSAAYVLSGPADGSDASTYYLAGDLDLDYPLLIEGNVALCLNGHEIRLNNESSTNAAFSTVYLTVGAALTLCDCEGGGNITHGKKDDGTVYPGRGVDVCSGSSFVMYGGSISGNSADGNGGGVRVYGTFTMYGGSISDNEFAGSSDAIGGGVHVSGYGNQLGTFTMYGGKISGNTAAYGGGVFVNSGTFVMHGGEISGNVETWGGGAGVYMGYNAVVSLSGGSITGNSATENGGAGSGIHMSDYSTSLTVSGDVLICDNFRNGTLNSLTGLYEKGENGTVSNVFLSSGKTLTIGEGGLGDDAEIGITVSYPPAEGETVTVATSASGGDAAYFTSDADEDYEFKLDGSNVVMAKKAPGQEQEHEHTLCAGTDCTDPNHGSHSATVNWIGVDSLSEISAGTSENPNYYYLTSDVTIKAATESAALDSSVSSWKMYYGWDAPDNVVLCLNGHDITMQNPDEYADKNVAVIRVTGNFTLTDCQTAQGEITHKDGSKGTGVSVLGGTFNMYGGQITENTTKQYSGGGGVSIGGVEDTTRSSVFNLYGGSITHNTASLGGGVYIHRIVWYGPAQFNMYGGSITDNTATVTDETPNSYGVGGGVYESWTAAFKMSGGTITNNTAKFGGAGLYLSALARSNEYDTGKAADFEISGSASITGNTVNGSANNVFLASDTADNNFETVNSTITIGNGGLASGASIGVTTENTLTTGSSVTIATGAANGDEKYFTSDADGEYHVTLDGSQVKLVNGTVAATYTVSFNANGGTGTMTDVTGVSGSYTLPANGFTAPTGKQFKGWATSADGAVISGTTIDVTADTTLYAIWENTPSSSGSSGGGSSRPAYAVTVSGDTKNGSVSVNPRTASRGDVVTITVTPDKGFALETVTVTDKNGDELALTDKGGGRYSFTMPSGGVNVDVTFMDDNTMLNFFVDIKSGNYFYDAVLWAAESGITSGTDAVHFSPYDACTRAQVVTFLWRAAGSPEPKSASGFDDVPSDSYYAKAVAWAVESGITGGTGNGRFSPDAACTRAQAVTFLYRAAGSPAVSGVSSFSDVSPDAYYAGAVVWAVENGITTGVGNGRFAPDVTCTRAQIATFIYRSSLIG